MATLTCGYDAAGNAKTYTGATDIADAIAAASASDVIEVYYADNKQNRVRGGTFTISKALTVRGMVGNQELNLNGPSSGQAVVFTASGTLENFTVTCQYVGVYTATGGVAYTVNRCRIFGDYGIYNAGAGGGTFNNCIIFGMTQATLLYESTTFNFCIARGLGASSAGFYRGAGTVNCYNCIGLDGYDSRAFYGSIGGTNNASLDGSHPATNGVNILTNNPHFWKDESAAFAGDDYRTTLASSLAGAGVAVGGVTIDMYGNARANPPSIGPFEAAAIPVAPDLNTVVSTSGGNWNVANVTAGNLPIGVTAGVANAIVGTFNEAARNIGTTADKILTGNYIVIQGTTTNGTFDEAARNQLSATANQILVGASVKVQNVTTAGTFDENARNVDPGANLVANGTNYVIHGANLTGTYAGGGNGVPGFDFVHWEYDGNGDLMPRPAALELNYPQTMYVLRGTQYGYANQYTGIFTLGGEGMAGKVRVYDNRDGSTARVHVTDTPIPGSTNSVYVAQFLQSGMSQLGPQSWHLVGTLTDDGEFDITLDRHVEYQVKLVTEINGTVGLAVGNTFWITDFATRRRLLMRDRTAKAAMRVAYRLGRRIWFKNPAHDHVELWATCEGGFESLGLLGGTTSATTFTLWVPRQTGFPPLEGLMVGASVWVEDTPYACTVRYDAELPFYAPVFRFDCERYDVTVELDGITPPPG